jgi:spermidine synthase
VFVFEKVKNRLKFKGYFMSNILTENGLSGTKTGISRRAQINLITFIYFVSGICSLIDEVVWVRLLKLTLGNTVYAASIVVSVFMGGLAIGAFIMGKYCDGIKKHLKLYALLETLITISALLLPWALRVADDLYAWFFQVYEPSRGLLMFVQVFISAIIVLIPSMLMGSTLPLLGRFITSLEEETGHLVGRLYALNMLGAATGCFVAGFVLIRSLGVMGTLYFAASLNLLVALGGAVLSRYTTSESEQEKVSTKAVALEDRIYKLLKGKFYILIIAFFMSGLISIGYEILWIRSMTHFLGGVTYVFSAVLTVYLIANVIGVGIGSRLAKKLKSPASGFAITLSLLGICGIFYLPVMVFWVSKVMPHVDKFLKSFYGWFPASVFTVEPMLQSFFLFLVPSVLMGIGFPLALQAWAYHVHKVGLSTGSAYSANTIGAVLGGIVTGFVLIPWLGLQWSIVLLGLAGLWIAGLVWFLFYPSKRLISRSSIIIISLIMSLFMFKVPSNLFHHIINKSPFIPSKYELLGVEEGVTTTVSVHWDSVENTLQLYASGQALAGEDLATRVDQKALGHFGVLLNKSTDDVVTIGFGSGETTNCLSKHNLDRLDCVEIAPEVVKVSLEYFNHMNLGDKLHDKVNMIFMDAKNYVHLTGKKYDVIVNDSIHPRHFAENASLYGKDFYEDARERLEDSGMIFIWVPYYSMPMSGLDSIVGTLTEVFPYVTIWYPNNHDVNYFWLVGSKEEQLYSPAWIDNELSKEDVKESLSLIGIENSEELLNYYVADTRGLITAVGDYKVNSDYHPFVEFSTEGHALLSDVFEKYVLNIRSTSLLDHIDWTGFDEKEKKEWISKYENIHNASKYALLSYFTKDYIEKLKITQKGLSEFPESEVLINNKEKIEDMLLSKAVQLIVTGRPNESLALANDILKVGNGTESGTVWAIRALAMQSADNMDKALVAIKQAVKLEPDDSKVRFYSGFIYERTGKFNEALEEYQKSIDLDDEQPSVLENMARLLISDNKSDYYDPKSALGLAEKACKLTNFREFRPMLTLADAYALNSQFERAVNTLEKALEFVRDDGENEREMIQERLKIYKAKLNI